MNAVEFHKLLRKAVIYYVADAPEYTRVMDDLSVACEEGQWGMVQEALEEADEFLADSDVGTLAQKERIAAKREKRQNRYPSLFDTDEVRAKQIAALAKEYTAHRITFRQEPEPLRPSELSYIVDLLAKDVRRQKDERNKRTLQELLQKVRSQIEV